MKNYSIDTFTEAFSAGLLPIFNEITLKAMHAFGGHALEEPIFAAAFGAALASVALYLLGRYGHQWLGERDRSVPGYDKVHESSWKACSACFMVLLCWVPIWGVLIMIIAGFWRLNPWMVIGLSLIAHGMHYQSQFLPT